MKRIILISAFSLFGCLAFSQSVLDQAVVDQFKKDKEKSDKAITDDKDAGKAATWMTRADVYSNIALQASTLDSNAVMTAYNAYKKVIELDVTKKGDAGRDSKKASDILAGKEGNLYNAFVKQGAEKYQAKQMEGALKMFQMAQEINGKDTTATLYGGIAAQQAEKNDIAVEEFEKYAANGGGDPSVFYGLSQLYKSDKKYDKAIAALEKGLVKSPDNKDLKSEIVNIHLASGNEDMAINQLQELTQKDPTNATNMVNLAILYDNINIKRDRKIKELQSKLGSTDKADAVNKQLETEKGKLDIYEGEIKRISGLLKKQPKSADLKRQLDEVNASRDESKTNVTKYETSAKEMAANANNGENSTVEKELAELKTKYKSDRQLIIDTYKKVLVANPDNYDALFNLGVLYFNEAVNMKSEVDNMDMKEYQARGKEVEGRVCGEFKKAKPYFDKAVAAKPDAEEAKSTLETLDSVLAQFEGKKVECVTVD